MCAELNKKNIAKQYTMYGVRTNFLQYFHSHYDKYNIYICIKNSTFLDRIDIKYGFTMQVRL